ncbi:hypothetical protein FTX61_18680 [Nitriliruptoraceae bacterium ZYF776]|nr:hypothetical protein [Profundirhabdus halotolerans]
MCSAMGGPRGRVRGRESGVGGRGAGSCAVGRPAAPSPRPRCWASTGAAGTGNCTAPAGATRFTYDADGRLTSSTDGRAFTYNAAGQTVEMTTPEGGPLSATYQMDTHNERVTAGNATFVSSLLGVTGQQVGTTRTAWRRDPDGNLLGQRVGTTRSYYLTDQLGSIIAVIDQTGQIRNRYRYTPDGEDTQTCPTTSGCVDNPWRFAGEFKDTTGLYKIGARYYQPDQATWTTPDPIQHRINPAQPGETNPYAYAGCNPINYTDPTGHAACLEEAGAGVFALSLLALAIATLPAPPLAVPASAVVGVVSSALGVSVTYAFVIDCVLEHI